MPGGREILHMIPRLKRKIKEMDINEIRVVLFMYLIKLIDLTILFIESRPAHVKSNFLKVL